MEASMDSSGMDPRNFTEHEQFSITGTESKGTTEWTDEKHRSFLNSMEKTFVNELYKSLDLSSSWHSSRKTDPSGSKSSKHKQTSVRSSSGQFKVCRDGNWSNTNFRRDEIEINQEQKPGVLMENPWIQHYRCLGRQVVMRRSTTASRSKGASGNTSDQNLMHKFELSRQDSTDSSTEESGQNFNDEDDLEEEEKSGRSSAADNIVSSSSLSKDQVVPLGKKFQRKELLLNLNDPPNDP